MQKENSQAGFIGLLSIIIATMIIGYIVISRLSSSDTGQSVQDTASDLIDGAKDSVDKANQATDKAGDIVEDANNLIENVQ